MENPDTYRAGKDLVEFEWRQNHRNFYSCFSLKFYREKDMPLLTSRFPDQSGDEMRESETDAFSNPIPWQLTWVQWFELQNMLAESDLPAYRKPSPNVQDETDSEIRVIWRTDDGNEIQKLSGSHAEALEAARIVATAQMKAGEAKQIVYQDSKGVWRREFDDGSDPIETEIEDRFA